MNLAFRNVWAITVNDDFDVLRHAAVVTEGDRITYVGPDEDLVLPEGKEFRVIDGKDRNLVMPGLVNGHTHLPLGMLRGSADDLPLQRWLDELIFPGEAKHTPETLMTGALLALAELTRYGVTCFNDMYMSVRTNARAVEQSGQRALLTNVQIGVDPHHYDYLRENIETAEEYAGHPRIRIGFGPHAEYTEANHSLNDSLEAALRFHAPLHIHVSETRKEHEECKARHNGMTPTQYLESIGYFQTKVLMAHCVWIEECDMDIIQKYDATVLHNPCSNMKLASGFAPLPRMLERGLNVALATDSSSSNNNLDLWEEMRAAALIHKANTLDATAVNARQALTLATRGGAEALGFTDTGCLVPGKKADLVMVDITGPSWHPMTDIVHHVVYAGSAHDIVMTVADGEVLYDHGVYTRLDVEKITAEADRLYRDVFA